MTLHASLVDLELPRRVKSLPVDSRGFPVPFFVAVMNGQPDHRIVDPDKLIRCVKSKLCWICGQPLGRNVGFVIGMLGALQRLSYEPPSHRECAEFAVKACPHLARPHAKNRPVDHSTGQTFESPQNHTTVRFGVHAVWITRTWEWHWRDSSTGVATFDNPEEVVFYRERQVATREVITTALKKAVETLTDFYKERGGDLSKIDTMVERTLQIIELR